MTLKSAFLWSLAVHLGLLTFQAPGRFVPPPERLEPVEVFYLPPPPAAQQEKVLPPRSAPPQIKTIAPPGVFPSPPPVQKISPEPPKPVPVSPPASVPAVKGRKPPPPVLEPAPTPSVSQVAQLLPEAEFAEVTHKEQVREHLRTVLRYPDAPIQGVVRIRLDLGPAGHLREVQILQASDARLAEAALAGIRQAVPYPRFPVEMKKRRARYEFLVHYRLP